MAQALESVVRRLDVLVGYQDDLDLRADFELGDLGALFVQQVGGDVDRHLRVDGRRALLERLFLDDAQHMQGRRLDIADHARAIAARTGDVRALVERRPDALARQLHQPEPGDLAGLHPGTVVVQCLFQSLLDFALIARVLHVDEIDDDQAAEVAQAHLPSGLVGRLEIGAQRRLLDVGALGRPRRVDVDRHQGLGVVDDDRTARGKRDDAGIRGLDLVLDLEAREQRRRVPVSLDPVHQVGHHVAHELLGLVVDLVGVDQQFADVGAEVVPDRADHQARLLVDQERPGRRARGRFDRRPQLQQVVQVPLQLLDPPPDACGARDQAHPGGVVELIHRFPQFLPVLALDAARHAATARVVRHQDQVAAGQRDEGRQRGALVAALFLVDLDDDFAALGDRILDAGLADVDAGLEERLGDLLERQEAMPLLAVVDEARLQTRFDAGDHALVDVALAGLAPRRLDVDVDQLLTIDDRHPQLFRVRGIEQHSLHIRPTPGAKGVAGARPAGDTNRRVRSRVDVSRPPPSPCRTRATVRTGALTVSAMVGIDSGWSAWPVVRPANVCGLLDKQSRSSYRPARCQGPGPFRRRRGYSILALRADGQDR